MKDMKPFVECKSSFHDNYKEIIATAYRGVRIATEAARPSEASVW